MATASSRTEAKNDWPFTIELRPVSDLFVDLTYQRPPQDKFVERLTKEFDETLVGTLDVSERSSGKNAIMDGAQRFQVVPKFKDTVWCTIYRGLSRADEAMFFYKKNRNRRNVHPYYQIRALIVTGDKTAININRIVESESYKLGIGAAQDNVLTAIRAIEIAYDLSSLQRSESLSATLRTMRACFYGRRGGKEGVLIRGLATFFQNFSDDEIDFDWLNSRLAGQNPQLLIGRAEDKYVVKSRDPVAYYLARDIADIYNRNRKGGQRLPIRLIQAK